MSKKISVRISGVSLGERSASSNTGDKDGRLKCNYIYITSDAEAEVSKETINYDYILHYQRQNSPFLITFEKDPSHRTEYYNGLFVQNELGNSYSFYRREYEEFSRTYFDKNSNSSVTKTQVYAGEWKPVAVNVTSSFIRDFNITAGRSYQYILYPNYTAQKQQFALMENSSIPEKSSYRTGDIFRTEWDEWSLTELIPIENEVDSPIVKKSYKVDIDNIWLFKYSLNTGAQTQNLSKNEINTLGQYAKVGYGSKNYISGEVSCYLGSEIIPYSQNGYIERLRGSIQSPLSTNERVKMLDQWRKIAYSKNPKLLKDIKGQSWIVQIFTNSNTPNNFYKNQPDMISFSWKQIEDPENCVVYGYGGTLPEAGSCSSDWKKVGQK